MNGKKTRKANRCIKEAKEKAAIAMRKRERQAAYTKKGREKRARMEARLR